MCDVSFPEGYFLPTPLVYQAGHPGPVDQCTVPGLLKNPQKQFEIAWRQTIKKYGIDGRILPLACLPTFTITNLLMAPLHGHLISDGVSIGKNLSNMSSGRRSQGHNPGPPQLADGGRVWAGRGPQHGDQHSPAAHQHYGQCAQVLNAKFKRWESLLQSLRLTDALSGLSF